MSQAARNFVALIVVLVVIATIASSGRGGPLAAGMLLAVGLPALVLLLRGAAGRND